MSSSLLLTKLNVPVHRTDLVDRPHLLSRLTESLTGRLTLLCAPAGYGKTTLLAQWVQQYPGRVGWLSLDEADNDLARFFRHLLAALRSCDPGLDPAWAEQVGAVPGSGLEARMDDLINALAQRPGPILLVLDDYHLIRNEAIHKALHYWLSHMPAQVHLILATRADPPMPLARMRARRELDELRAADLRFSEQETARYVALATGYSMQAEQAALLESRTEGWVTGLQLAALSMKGRTDLPHYIASLAGRQGHIADYLTEEVLAQQPDAIRRFLLQTSILERICAPLCAALLHESEGSGYSKSPADWQGYLEYLHQQNLFVVALDDERRWYRYHHLFADLQRYRLQQADPDLAAILHGRAARWFAANGYPAEAIDHALSGQDWEVAATLVEKEGFAFLQRSEVTTLLHWLGALPAGWTDQRPVLTLLAGLAELNAGRGETAAALLASVNEERLPPPLRPGLWVGLAQLRWFEGSVHGVLEQTGKLLAAAGTATGESGEAADSAALMLAVTFRAEALRAGGMLREAADLYQQTMERARARGLERLSPAFAGNLAAKLALILVEQNDLANAEQLAHEGLRLARQGRQELFEANACQTLALVTQALGRTSEARAFAEDAMRIAERRGIAHEKLHVQAMIARMDLRMGSVEPAAAWARTYTTDPARAGLPPMIREYTDTTLVRVRLAQGQYAEAAALCVELADRARAAGRLGILAELGLLHAEARRGQGDRTGAASPLMERLSARELEVLRLLGQGRMNSEIAEELVITVGTVKRHVSNLCGKLGTTSRREAVARARELRLI